ncbi:MAG: putative RNA uridine N3 methyltransferase [Candidatus Bathyarchaeia archaeon]
MARWESFKPGRRSFHLSILIPGSLVDEEGHLRDKTFTVGLIGRAAAIFRVDEVCVYRDLYGVMDQGRSVDLIASILRYMETPPHLKRKLIGLKPELRYAGILPPLRLPSHTPPKRIGEAISGEVREAVVERGGAECYVDAGFDRPVRLVGVSPPRGSRITVRLFVDGGEVYCKLVDPSKLRFYWSFQVSTPDKPLKDILEDYRSRGLVIAASKYGDPIELLIDELSSKLLSSKSLAIAFGSPKEGLREIAGRQGFKLGDYVDYIVNTIPGQGSYTVRTEEAVYATLAVLNLISSGRYG